MNKKTLLTFGCIVLILIIAIFTGVITYQSTPVNLNLDAAKLDNSGNATVTIPISISGTLKDYVFQNDILDVSIEPFDGFPWFKLDEDASSGKSGLIRDYANECKKITFYSASSSGDIVFCSMLFTKDFEYIALICDESAPEPTVYIASANSNKTAEEVLDYFRTLIPGFQPF